MWVSTKVLFYKWGSGNNCIRDYQSIPSTQLAEQQLDYTVRLQSCWALFISPQLFQSTVFTTSGSALCLQSKSTWGSVPAPEVLCHDCHISRWKIKAGLADGDVTPSVRFPAAPVKLQRPWLCQRGTTTMPIMGTSNVSEIYICEQIVCLAPISCAVWWTEQKKGSVLTWTASSMKTWRSVWGNWQTGGKRHEHRALRGRRWH